MNRPFTNRDFQRLAFVESLHSSLNKQASKAIEDNRKFITLASSYLEDGLDESECIELLMIDGIERHAAESYVVMAQSNQEDEINDSEQNEYSFQVEDDYGKVWSSIDINRTIKAASEDSAWEKVENLIGSDPQYNFSRVVSISRL